MEMKHPPLLDPLPFPSPSSESGVFVPESSVSNVAITKRFMLMTTSQVELVPEQAPLQPVKLEPASAVGVSVTTVPAS